MIPQDDITRICEEIRRSGITITGPHPGTKTYSGETFICDRCNSTMLLSCPVCRGAAMRPADVREMERNIGRLYRLRCEWTRWLWSPAGTSTRRMLDLFQRMLGLSVTMAMAAAITVYCGRLIINHI